MRPARDEPIPLEQVRDLLGIARALYVARRTAGAGALELQRIEQAGRELDKALELCASPEGTLGHTAAWTHVERAVETLKHCVDVTTPIAPLLVVAAERIVGGGRP